MQGGWMMRITVVNAGADQRLKVEGKLAALEVSELESAWKQARQTYRGRIVVDLSEVMFIDSSGEAALMGMIREGARLTAKSLYGAYLVEHLVKKAWQACASRDRLNRASVMDSSSANLSSEASRRSRKREKE
jgi:ABC-type transporter Mla MlaB component